MKLWLTFVSDSKGPISMGCYPASAAEIINTLISAGWRLESVHLKPIGE